MKKTRFLLFLATVAFAATGFTACTSEDEIADPATSIDGEFGEPIKAQFTISIPMNSKSTTRMSATTVQDGQDVASFRGIDFINLFPSTAATIGATSTLGNAITLSQILRPQQVAVSNYIPSGKLVSNNNSVLYGDVLLPTGIKSFLFYGKAIDVNANSEITTAANKFKYGTLKTNITTTAETPEGFTFSLVPIVESATAGSAKRTAILNYLNSIAQAKDESNRYWYQEVEDGGNLVLGGLYTNFITMKAGSSESIIDAIGPLYRSLKDNAHTVAKAVCKAILTSGVTADTNGYLSINSTSDMYNYPGVINLPAGSAVLKFDNTTHSFSYAGIEENYPGESPVVSDLNVAKITSFVYPANLYYWVNSPIKVSASSQADNYVSTKLWADILGAYDDLTDAGITNSTRSVALINPVQYGVGRLDTKVVANSSTLDDNGASHEDGKKSVSVNDIKLTGILIGQQKPVDWKFNTQDTETQYTIYDNITVANGSGISISTTIPTNYQNHTLVLETKGSATECVNVALEFEYTGTDDIWGINGRIRNGEKFYLLGKLDMSDENTSGQANTGNKVFAQDFKTQATFKISSLKQAYNTIPDLRNPRIELGLSVDLVWQEGVTFEDTID
jgi:hypothetical protein